MECISIGNHILTVDKSKWILGHWNAYVAKGPTRDIRRKLMKEVPDIYKDGVRKHVKTVNQLLNRTE